MNEKKLTDDEIVVNALEERVDFINKEFERTKTPINFMAIVVDAVVLCDTLDLIHRLQADNESLKKDYIELDLEFRELRTELDKELAEHEEFTKKANEEIERLTKENKQYFAENERLNESCGIYQIKLEEQIKETYDYVHKAYKLKKRNAELQKQVDELKIKTCPNTDYCGGRIQQAVKDTAKEIFEWLEKHCFFNCFEIVEAYFKERYGVEVG